ncbi:MAG: GYD domain-containing protein [Candidatus Hodarchaeota archaeon]
MSPMYILATKFENIDIENRKEQGEKWYKLVKKKVPNIKWIAHYAILGPYDFLDIFEADNEVDAAKVSLLSRATGATIAESWTAIPYLNFIEFIEDLK